MEASRGLLKRQRPARVAGVSRRLREQVARLDPACGVGRCPHDGGLDGVCQLAHVARPLGGLDGALGAWGEHHAR